MPKTEQTESERIAALEKTIERMKADKEKADQPLPQKTAKVMFHKDLPVVKVGEARDFEGVLSMKLTVRKEDGKDEDMSVGYLDAMNNFPRFLVEVTNVRKEPIRTHQGPVPMKVRARMSDEVGRKTPDGNPFSPRDIFLEQTKYRKTAHIRFLEGPWEGKELDVDAKDCLNK